MKILNFFALLLIPSLLQASHENDLQLLSKFKIEKKIIKKENLNIFYGHRLRENITIKSKALYDFSYQRSFKKINIRLGFRSSNNFSKNNQKSTSLRYYFDISHRLKINDFNISTRSRFQNQSEMEEVEEVLRFKISLSNSKLKKIKPEISYEYFQDLTNEIENKFRLTTSINFDLKKRFEYEIYYRIQSRTNNLDNSSIYIIGSTLSYNIK